MKKRIETTLQDVCVETTQRDPRNIPNEYFTYVDIASINRERKLVEEYKTIIGSEAPSRARKEIRVNDVIVSTVRPNLNAVAIISKELDGQIASTGFCILRPNQAKISPCYLFYFVCSNYFVDYLVNRASGASYPSVTDTAVKSTPIHLPPLPEQERIVRLLDEAESLRAKRTCANVRMEQFVPALFQEMFGNIVTNDKRWQMVQFSEVVKKEKYSLMRGPFGGSVKKEIFVPDGYKIYEQKHAIQDNFDLGNYFIDETKYKELISFAIQPDDLIVSCSGTIGKVAIIPSTAKPGIINQALMKIRPDQEIALPIFVKLLLETNHMQLEFFGGAEGSAIKNVKPLKYIKQTKVPLPPLALQREFAARVGEARGVQSAQGRSAKRIEALYQSMLSRAFAGEL